MASGLDRLGAAIARVERSDPELAKATRDGVQRESLRGLGGEPESIIHRTQRPVLLVAKDDIVLDLAADSEIWRQRLSDARANLQAAIRAVGDGRRAPGLAAAAPWSGGNRGRLPTGVAARLRCRCRGGRRRSRGASRGLCRSPGV
jgi:hypothetical protein